MRHALGRGDAASAPQLPRLLWTAPGAEISGRLVGGLLGALVGACVLAVWWPKLVMLAVVLLGANMLVDDWANLRVAHRARALGVLAGQLAAAARVVALTAASPAIHDELVADLAAVARLRKRISILAVSDPFGIMDLLRSALLLRLVVLRNCAALVARDRDRLRRIVMRLGELDALAGLAELRAERDDARTPQLRDRAGDGIVLAARDVVHPAVERAIGNDVTLADGGLIITGSNMSGKSTFLRAVAINAICAQSIGTTFGTWSAELFRVVAVMRVVDDTASGASKYAVEVEAIGAVVAAASRGDGDDDTLRALIVVDEPFSGTNPAVRVPIVVSVLEYLGAHDVVIAATHDLEVAAQLGDRFQRGYFAEVAGSSDEFDRRLRPGVSPATNAVERLAHAGYPAAILDDVARRLGF